MRNLTLRQLRVFTAVARHQSFTRAARELHLTQQAVSQQMRLLEQEAGLAVRYRTSRHYYRVSLEKGTHLRVSARLPLDEQFRVSAWRTVAEAPFT